VVPASGPIRGECDTTANPTISEQIEAAVFEGKWLAATWRKRLLLALHPSLSGPGSAPLSVFLRKTGDWFSCVSPVWQPEAGSQATAPTHWLEGPGPTAASSPVLMPWSNPTGWFSVSCLTPQARRPGGWVRASLRDPTRFALTFPHGRRESHGLAPTAPFTHHVGTPNACM
jgi:hypothetical protein